MKVYVASSWKTPRQPEVVEIVREAGHEPYDFRNPAPGNDGFHFSRVWPHYKTAPISADDYVRSLTTNSYCAEGFAFDMDALQKAGALVLVMPAGRSAHLELGYAAGSGKPTAILLEDPIDGPDLMHMVAGGLLRDYNDLWRWLRELPGAP